MRVGPYDGGAIAGSAASSAASSSVLLRRFAAEGDSHDDFKPKAKVAQGGDMEGQIKKWVSENRVFIFMKVRGEGGRWSWLGETGGSPVEARAMRSAFTAVLCKLVHRPCNVCTLE